LDREQECAVRFLSTFSTSLQFAARLIGALNNRTTERRLSHTLVLKPIAVSSHPLETMREYRTIIDLGISPLHI
jgi:hypothetical protein